MRRLALALALFANAGTMVACLPDPSAGTGDAAVASGGRATSSGGARSGTGATGTGGSGDTGGQMGTGGDSVSGSGGQTVAGGGRGGATTAGGRGGAGTVGTGGSSGRGGAMAANGGRGVGGGSSGGMTIGGRGGGPGGAATGGSASGGSGSGGVQGPTACTNIGAAHNGNGSFTFYWFAQGSARDGAGYRTACGYYGTANGQIDTVQNVASMSPANATYFAAIPGTSGFNSRANCGACVQVTGQNGRNIIATIADECPYGTDGGNTICGANAGNHLDLSKAAFDQLGFSVGDPRNTTWKFVPCPVTGNLTVRVKPGNPNELFIENTILAVTAVQGATRTSYGAWHFNADLTSGQSIQLTDVGGRTLTIQLPGTAASQNQDAGRQFPACQ